MSFWDNVKKFAQPYGDDDYDEYEDEEVVEGFEEEAEEEVTTSRRSRRGAASNETASYDYGLGTASEQRTASAGFSGQILNVSSGKQEVVLFHPSTFNDTSKAADDLRNKKAVIVNMENVDKAMARRVVDFLSGCAYALDGTVKKIAQSTYLFCPYNMEVTGDLENLQSEVESYI